MTVQQAIDEGYEYYLYADDEFQRLKHLTDLLLEDNAEHISSEWARGLELVEKEPYHPAGIDAAGLLEQIGDQLQNDHSGESGDDTSDVEDAVKDIDHAIVQPLIDAIAEKLNGLNYYRSTGIKLVRNYGTLGTEEGDVCNRDKCQGIIVEEDTESSCSCHLNAPCSYCTTDRHFCPECGWEGEKA